VDFLATLRKLSSSGSRFVVVGGVAASLYGSTRLTTDLDLVTTLDEGEWGTLVETLFSMGLRPRIPETKEAVCSSANIRRWIDEKGMLALSFRSDDGSEEVDLIVSLADQLEGFLERSTTLTWDGTQIAIAGLDDLIAMKTDAGRPQDLLDIELLKGLQK
jgi:predicted nucleotidyltransferase